MSTECAQLEKPHHETWTGDGKRVREELELIATEVLSPVPLLPVRIVGRITSCSQSYHRARRTLCSVAARSHTHPASEMCDGGLASAVRDVLMKVYNRY